MAINVQTAIEIISNLTLDLNFEIVPIENATSRICAQEIFATSFLPKFNNSAMDGYAIIYEDKNSELEIIDTIFAGDNNNKLLEKNSCIKIMTGAKIPQNSTAIIPKEDQKNILREVFQLDPINPEIYLKIMNLGVKE